MLPKYANKIRIHKSHNNSNFLFIKMMVYMEKKKLNNSVLPKTALSNLIKFIMLFIILKASTPLILYFFSNFHFLTLVQFFE